MVTRSEAVKNFLTAKTRSDLANLYHLGMECQVNVAQDKGERIEGNYRGRQWHGWSDGTQTWKSFRIPYKANTEPEYTDVPMKFDLAIHAEGIGMTGWDWENKVSKWLAYDFDSIIGHTGSKALNTRAEIQEIAKTASEIPWVTVRTSTSGSGLHLYVELDPVIPTANHNEHAALARAILGAMSASTGFDFSAKIDVCGGNMWVWHRKMKDDGLRVTKQGYPLDEIPANWRDHIPVVSGRRKKTVPNNIDEGASEAERIFEELTGQRPSITLDDQHKKLIDHIREAGFVWWWDADNHMLVTHTGALADAHAALSLKGLFETSSASSDPHTQNCFAFPIPDGGWIIRRFTPGVQEADTWGQDASGWTRCYFNTEPDLKTAARSFDGVEHDKKGFMFRTAEMAIKAAEAVGVHPALPLWAMGRASTIRRHKDGRMIMEIKRENQDIYDDMKGWLSEKDCWRRIFDRVVEIDKVEVGNYDYMVRHLVTEAGDDCGWSIKASEEWRGEPFNHIKIAMKSMGHSAKDVDQILGSSIFQCWQLVSRPFEPEYPGNRQWNRGAAQCSFTPSSNRDDLKHPTWDKILNHVGHGLDEAVESNSWCKDNGIISGADYLLCWIASLFQEPREPLPYLFLFGPQNSGKSVLHEALSLLLTHGYQRADNCLSQQSQFNGELEGCVIAVVEETDLKRNKSAYNRIKDWVTSKHLNIRHLYRSPYHVPNTTHWIHCANEASACPVFAGDTRITMCFVDNLNQGDAIPKKFLFPKLEHEAPDFLAKILYLEIPRTNDRLNIPILMTADKEFLQSQNKSPVNEFFDDIVYRVDGEMEAFSKVYEQFLEWLDPSEVHDWSKIKFGKELPTKFPKGRRKSDGTHYIGNMSFTPGPAVGPKIIVRAGRLCPSTERPEHGKEAI